ncbi:MAG: hypothetical protein HYW33_04030 [Candidatus Blackburnbacteria bacterium]|nr:hypothetical protein [Candidatus Blackburnbacteria bacterium]
MVKTRELIASALMFLGMVVFGFHLFGNPTWFFLYGIWTTRQGMWALALCAGGLFLAACDAFGTEKCLRVVESVFTFPLTYNALGALLIIGMVRTAFYMMTQLAQQAISPEEIDFLWKQLVVGFVVAVACEFGGAYSWYAHRR